MSKSISIADLKAAVEVLFSHKPPKKHLTTEFIARCVQEYLQLNQPPDAVELMAALREVEHCVPRPMMRQKGKVVPEIRWVFVAVPSAKPKKKTQQRHYKEKPIAKSLKLKMA